MNIALIIISLLSKYLNTWEEIGLLLSLLIPYSVKIREFKLFNTNDDEMKFGTLAFSLLFIISSIYLPKYVIFSSLFLSSLLSFKSDRPLIRLAYYSALSTVFLFYIPNPWSYEMRILASLTSSLTAVLIEEAEVEANKGIVVMISSGVIFLTFDIYPIFVSFKMLFIAFLIAFSIGYIALRFNVADFTGLLSATIIGMLTILFNPKFFILLISFFIFGSVATKFKYDLKKSIGIAEPAGGARGYVNVFANTIPAVFFALNYKYFQDQIFSALFASSIAVALGDTLASEIGQTSFKAYMITNLSKVKPGTDGAISFRGELAALIGCSIIAILGYVVRIYGVDVILPVLIAGFIGVHIDSFLGATLEKRGILNNAGVNFFSTLSGGVLAYLFLTTYF